MTTAPPGARRARLRLEHIEGMRAAAALVVLLNHAWAQYRTPLAAEPSGWPVLFVWFMALGHLAVSVFIVISGFCLMLPVVRADGVLRGGAADFFRRRVRRILPPYYMALFLSLALIWTVIGKPTGTLWDVPIAYRPQDLVAHLLLLQDVFGTGKINYAFWSIATEWQIYFFFPALVLSFRRFGPAATTAIALVASQLISLSLQGTRAARANPHYFGLFVLGMLAACLATSPAPRALRAHRLPWGALAMTALGAAAALIHTCGWHGSISRWIWLDPLVALGTFCLLVASSRGEPSLVARVFAVRPLVWIGAFSYSLYLIHAPLLQLFWQYLMRPLGLLAQPGAFAFLLLAGCPLIVFAAWGFFWLFERPFLGASAKAAQSKEASLAA